MTGKCGAVDCGCRRARGQLMCRPHWYMVPLVIRQRVNQTWRAYQAQGYGDGQRWLDYIEATDDARKAVADAEGKAANFKPDLPRLKALHALRKARPAEAEAGATPTPPTAPAKAGAQEDASA